MKEEKAMDMLLQLKGLYEKYKEDLHKVRAKASPIDGLFGMGDDPRRDPCHMRFYEDVEQWVKDFLKTGPGSGEVYEAVHWIITTPASHREEPVFWFEFAAHGLCRELVRRIDPAGCAALQAFYDDHYPRRDRMPVQKEVYKLLKKGAAKS